MKKYLLFYIPFLLCHTVALASTPQSDFEHGRFADAVQGWQVQQKNQYDARRALRIAHAYLEMGLYTAAQAELQAILLPDDDTDLQVAWLIAQGRLLLTQDHAAYQKAKQHLQQALEKRAAIQDPRLRAELLNHAGNLYSIGLNYPAAIAAYQEALALPKAQSPDLTARIQLNLSRAMVRQQLNMKSATPDDFQDSLLNLQGTAAALEQGENHYFRVFAYLQIHTLAQQIAARLTQSDSPLLIHATLQQAVQLSDHLGHPHAQADSYGTAGRWYLNRRQLDKALDYARRALFFSRQVRGGWTVPQWLRLQGQIRGRQGHLSEALKNYQQAAKQLNEVRHKLTNAGYRPPRSFREQIAPLYFEWADLSLQQAATLKPGPARQGLLKNARDSIEQFKQAELQNYLDNPCLNTRANCRPLDELLEDGTAILYPILFPDRLTLLLSLPDSIRSVDVAVDPAQFQDTVTLFLSPLRHRPYSQKRARHYEGQPTPAQTMCALGTGERGGRKTAMSPSAFRFLPHARRLYQWLIQPIAADLQSHAIENLIIVPDGSLRTLPFAALHDGERYLIERYAIGTAAGLCASAKPGVQDASAKVLLAGISKATQGFSPIPCAGYELQTVHELYKRQGSLLLDEGFQLSAFRDMVVQKAYSIVHIASHGEFNADVDKTSLLAYDGKLTLDKFEQFNTLRKLNDKPIDLLVLSACETAKGNDRAALGLAGVVLKAGARSTLASLWKIDDNATPAVIIHFYRRFSAMNKIQALRHAQLQLLQAEEYADYRHPYYWAAFLMIGDWQ